MIINFSRFLKLSLFSLILFFGLLYGYYLKSGQFHISEFCLAENCFNVYITSTTKPMLIKPPRNQAGKNFASRANAVFELREQLMTMCQNDSVCLDEIIFASHYEMTYLKEFVSWCNQDQQCREKFAIDTTMSVTPNHFLSWKAKHTWGKWQQSINRWMIYIIAKLNEQHHPAKGQNRNGPSKFRDNHRVSRPGIESFLLPSTISVLKAVNNSPVFCGMAQRAISTKSSGLQRRMSLLTEKKQLFIFIAATDQLFLGKSLNYFEWIFATEKSIFQKRWDQFCA